MTKGTHNLLIAYSKGYRCDEKGNVISPLGNLLKLRIDSRGYQAFSVNIGLKGGKGVPVHRLQAYMKFGDRIFEKNIHVRHLDGNPTNNSYDNIGIGTPYENSMDRDPEDRMKYAINASTGNRKFTDDEMVKILEFYDGCKSYKQTMQEFGITSKGSLWFMLNNRYVTKKQ